MKTLIILHGWGSSKERWENIKKEVEKTGTKVIVPDLPGFKKETELDKAWTVNDYANWLNDYIKTERISDGFYLLGHSFGGGVALKFTLRYPQRVGKLFLVASACVRAKTLKKKYLAKISKFLKLFSFVPYYPLLKKGFYKYIVRKSDYQYTSGFLKETYLNVVNEDLSMYLPSVKVPTVIIWGDQDTVTPTADAYYINKLVPGSKLELVPGANHDLHIKFPEVLSKKINDNL